MTRKDRRYRNDRQHWYSICQNDSCKEKPIKCRAIVDDGTICNRNGHKVIWIDKLRKKRENGSIFWGVDVLIAHAHYIQNRDTGRHVCHKSHEDWIDEKFTKLVRTIDGRHLPDHVRDELES